MTKSNFVTGLSYRSGGWSAIASGTFGLLAFAALFTAVFTRTTWELTEQVLLLFNIHNALAILQFLLMIPLVVGMYNLSHKKSPGMSHTVLGIGIVALILAALFLSLFLFPKIMSDEYYMFPQAIYGIWLMVVNVNLKSVLPRWLRWFGIVVGFGLALVGVYFIGFAVFVDSSSLRIPAPNFESLKDPGDTTANIIVHIILNIGSFLGVLTLPFWSIIMGRKLLREK